MVQTQLSHSIKVFRVDNAMEYKETNFLKFLREQGTISQYFCPGISQHNGRVEHKHRYILDIVRILLITSGCPESFWGKQCLLLFTQSIAFPYEVFKTNRPIKGYMVLLPPIAS